MPTIEQAPSISRIYAAFDPASERVFRRAMYVSRGGIVRVEDLLTALAVEQPAATALALGVPDSSVALLARRVGAGSSWVPMSNEPALRALLESAYLRTEVVGERPLTPDDLLATIVAAHSSDLPPALAAPSIRQVTEPQTQVLSLLRGWLAAQKFEDDAAKRAEFDQLKRLVSEV